LDSVEDFPYAQTTGKEIDNFLAEMRNGISHQYGKGVFGDLNVTFCLPKASQ
jgi:hypothetical protein